MAWLNTPIPSLGDSGLVRDFTLAGLMGDGQFADLTPVSQLVFPPWYLASLFKAHLCLLPSLSQSGASSPAQSPTALSSSILPARRPSLPGRTAEAEAPIGRGPLGYPPASSAVTSPAPDPLPSRGRLPGSSGVAGGREALPHIAKRGGKQEGRHYRRKEPRTEGAEDGRREAEP